MNQSDTIGNLAAALSKAQATMKPADMNSVNPFFKSKYADLGAIIEAIRPTLGENGLAFTQEPTTDGATVSVTTTIMHASGEWRAATMSLPIEAEKGLSLVQSVGKQITYLKRYGLGGAFGVNTDFDEDGNTAATGNGEKPQIIARPPATPAGPAPTCPKCHGPMWDNRGTPERPKKNPKAPDWKCRDVTCDGVIWPPKDTPAERQEAAGQPVFDNEPPPDEDFDAMPSASDAPISDTLRKAMFAQAKKVYGDNNAEFRAWVHEQYHVESSNDLTIAQASEIIEKLRKVGQPA
jgi:hypothetical protein